MFVCYVNTVHRNFLDDVNQNIIEGVWGRVNDNDKRYNSASPPLKYIIRTPRTFIHSRTRHLGSIGVINLRINEIE